MRTLFLPLVSLVIALFVSPRQGLAWSNKEHIQLTRIAVMLLVQDPQTPEEMKRWLRDVTPDLSDMAGERDYFMHARVGIAPRGPDGLPLWSTMPDVAALIDGDKRPVPPFEVNERLLHFLDLEIFNGPDESQWIYKPDLSSKPPMSAIPKDITDPRFKRAGMLPFRVEQSQQRLIELIRQKRLADKPGQFPRDEHAMKWAGYLAHYAQDNTQPHHASVDYKSASYLANLATRAPNVHAKFEYGMCDDEFADYMDLREQFWPMLVEALEKFADPVKTDDPWTATIEVSMASYDALPLIGDAASAATNNRGTFDMEKFFLFKGKVAGEEMTVMQLKARQQAWAVKRTMRLWLQAWRSADSET